jgi:branched-chain amino acid transport system ATP-binding protein
MAAGVHPAASTALPSLLDVRGLTARYGRRQVLHQASIRLDEGEFVTILGPNGAGKTTLLRAIMRLVAAEGAVLFKGSDVTRLSTHGLARRGVIMVQEGRGLFGQMTVRENLDLGAYTAARPATLRRMEEVLALFPRLRERFGQIAASMSGGEQQMLVIGRALMAAPKLLLLDEPSLGLAPRAAEEIFTALAELNRRGLGILLVEQKAPLALRLASRIYVLAVGRVVAELAAGEVGSHHDLARYYLG